MTNTKTEAAGTGGLEFGNAKPLQAESLTRDQIITSQAEEIERLRLLLSELSIASVTRANTLTTRIGELEGALKPFAAELDKWTHIVPGPDIDHWPINGNGLTLGDLRRARAALTKEPT
jgi:hypothetical protein